MSLTSVNPHKGREVKKEGLFEDVWWSFWYLGISASFQVLQQGSGGQGLKWLQGLKDLVTLKHQVLLLEEQPGCREASLWGLDPSWAGSWLPVRWWLCWAAPLHHTSTAGQWQQLRCAYRKRTAPLKIHTQGMWGELGFVAELAPSLTCRECGTTAQEKAEERCHRHCRELEVSLGGVGERKRLCRERKTDLGARAAGNTPVCPAGAAERQMQEVCVCLPGSRGRQLPVPLAHVGRPLPLPPQTSPICSSHIYTPSNF